MSMLDRPITRRKLLATSAGLGAMLLLAACGATPAPTTALTAAAAPTATTAAAGPTATTAAAAPTATTAAAAPTATTAAAGTTATPAAEATAATGMPTNLAEYFNATRAETLILDNPYRLEGADNWNPFVPGNATGWGLATIAKEPLLYLSQVTGELEPWLAQSVTPNEDFTVWTITLKDGITWADGVPFTIDDVIYSIELQKSTEPLGNYYVYNEWVDTVEKVDDLTATITLLKPNPRFAMERFRNICGYDWFVPKHIWETVEDPLTFKNFDLEAGLPLATGPYILYRLTSNEAIWVRNDNWWAAKAGFKKLPAPKKVIYSYAGTEEVRVATAADNGFDGLQDITLSSYEALLARNTNWEAFRPELPYVWPDPCARTLSINCALPPWEDKDMRWVLSYIMDRPQIIDVAYEGSTIPGSYFWPLYPSMQRYTDLISEETQAKFATPNPEAAQAILETKGYSKGAQYWEKDGQQLGLEIQVHEAFSELERIADVYIEQLQRFGINGVKAKLTGQTWGDNNALGNYAAQSGWQTCGSIAEPYSTLRTMAGREAAPIGERWSFSGEVRNQYRYVNPDYTDIVIRLGEMGTDDPEYMDLAKQAIDVIYDELPAIPMAQSRKLIPWNHTYWTNFPTQENYYEWPVLWCSSFINMLPEIQPVQA
ncbi:MAG: ABC transporter substrate-binding protein [Anaerolineae bacterium]